MTRSTRERRVLPLLAAAAILAAATAQAKLAVFVDGRALKVTDAVLEGDRIRLELPSGGRLIVPATRVDRVVDDEVPEAAPGPPVLAPSCAPYWKNEPLPENTPFRRAIARAARKAGIHPWLLAALVQTESAFDPRALSRAGAAGLTQLMPAAAADHGVRNVWDVAENLRGGAEHLRALLDRFGDLGLALAAYNAGAATVERYHGVPPYRETRSFVRRVLSIFCPPESAGRDGTAGGPGPTGRS